MQVVGLGINSGSSQEKESKFANVHCFRFIAKMDYGSTLNLAQICKIILFVFFYYIA
jgi:hypothetical protein